MTRVKADIVMRYNEMIFEARKRYLKFKEKMEFAKLVIDYLQEEKEIIRKMK